MASQDHVSNDPLHGVTLKVIVTTLSEDLGWEELDRRVRINCFHENPSINSSLKFLRKTPWAREKVERLYVRHLAWKARGPAVEES